jgi:hypothetical protein
MLIGLSAIVGFFVGVAFYRATGQGRSHLRQLQYDNDNLRHVISELSMHKYGPRR